VIGITPALVAAVAREIDARRGDRVRAAHQDSESRFRLALEGPGGRADLVLDLDPDGPRAHLAPAAPAPAAPTPLAGSMRNALEGARLDAATAVPGERALHVRFSLAGLARSVWFEGFGRQANLYVLDEAGRVLLTPRGEAAKARGAGVGSLHAPVPPREPAPAWDGSGSPSEAVLREAEEAAARRAFLGRRTRLVKDLRLAARKAAGTVARLEAMEAREGEAEGHRRRGELLRGSFDRLAPGLAAVRVTDWSVDPPVEVEVPLDPSLEPGEQVAACFREEGRCRRAAEEARARLPGARERVAVLERALALAEAAADVAGLDEAERAAGIRPRRAPGKRKEPAERVPWRTFRSVEGWDILVGKDAKGNDALTLRHARPWDLFLHVRGGSGSHVVVPTPRGKTVPLETLLDAAELACVYSDRKDAERNEVDHVERRHVRKPRGSPPGLVTLDRSRTLSVRKDEARRARLLASPRPE
jgi:predicted ribosome quality control (RQC) complex YloA/Tae2 family protein